MIETAWLNNQTVPLWAFLLALLTRPTVWSREAAKAIKSLLGRTRNDDS